MSRVLPVILIASVALAADGVCCAQEYPIVDANTHFAQSVLRPFLDSRSDPPAAIADSVLRSTLQRMDRFGIRVTVPHTIFLNVAERWRTKAPARFVPAVGSLTLRSQQREWPSIGMVRRLLEEQKVGAIGEIYISPRLPESDATLDAYLALAEEFDIPASFHLTGIINPAIADKPTFALTQQGILTRHPRLRVQLGHAGYPWLAETIALVRTFPDRVYADIAMIAWNTPPEEFRAYLGGLMRAGLGSRLMFATYATGDVDRDSDWTTQSIAAIVEAPFLSEVEKRDLFCNNAARFFRLPASVCQR